jgi:hypothetical protein
VKWFDASGRLMRTLGRKGRGPGEFSSPFYPRFGPDGHIHVVDLGQGSAISVFDEKGSFVRRTGPLAVSPVGGLAVLDDGGYVVTGYSRQTTSLDVVHRLDSQGMVKSSMLPIRDVLPEGETPSPVWDHVRAFHLAFNSPHVFVTAALADSLWSIDLGTGMITAARVRIPGGEPPVQPMSGNPQDVATLVQWARSQRFMYTPIAAGDHLVLSFMRGKFLDDMDVSQLVRDRNGLWWRLTESEVVLGVGGGFAVTIKGNADSLRALYYRP